MSETIGIACGRGSDDASSGYSCINFTWIVDNASVPKEPIVDYQKSIIIKNYLRSPNVKGVILPRQLAYRALYVVARVRG